MQTIVVLIADTPDADPSATLLDKKLATTQKPRHQSNSQDSGESIPPFWTWFIENSAGHRAS